MSKTVNVQGVAVAARAVAVEECMDYALLGAVAYSGGVMTGLSVKVRSSGYLVTIRALFPAGYRVSHVGGKNMTEAFLKAVRQCKSDKMVWKRDKYRPD